MLLTLGLITVGELVLTQHELATRRLWLGRYRDVKPVPLSIITDVQTEEFFRGKFCLRTLHRDDTPSLLIGHSRSEKEREWLAAVVMRASEDDGDATASTIPHTLQPVRKERSPVCWPRSGERDTDQPGACWWSFSSKTATRPCLPRLEWPKSPVPLHR